MIGPGKAFDTDRYFVICSNILGDVAAPRGPAPSIPPRARLRLELSGGHRGRHGAPQKVLLDHLGIERLLAVAGGSMGGMQALEWAVAYPESRWCIPIATTARPRRSRSPSTRSAARRSWRTRTGTNGDYYGGKPPARGLGVARMVGHITYLSDESMHRKFGRRLRERRVRLRLLDRLRGGELPQAPGATASSGASTPTAIST